MNDTSKLCMKCMLPGLGGDGICEKCKTDEKSLWAAPHHLRPRTVLNGRYIVGRVIGEGGFGISYVGWDATLSIKVAIKEYYPAGFASRDSSTDTSVHSFSGDKGDFYAEGCDRFIEEAQRLARFFGMPGIVSVKDFFKENGTAYIVMEFVEGSTMRIILESMGNKLPEAHVMEMMKPLVISLANMHNQGVIHRDIAPDNIMVQPDGTVKLLDFGAARDMVTDGKSTAAVMKHGYAPEEQYDTNRQRQGPWTDVYALCATIFRAIEGVTPPDAIARLRADEFRGFNQPVSENTRSVIMKGLALAPENRWQNIEQLAKALYPNTSTEQMRSAAPAAPATPAAPAKPAPLADKKKPAILAAAAVLVLFIIAGGFFIFGGGSDSAPEPAHFADTPSVGFDTGAGGQQGTPAATEHRNDYGRHVAEEFLSNFTAIYFDYSELYIYMANLLGIDTADSPWQSVSTHLDNLRDPTTWRLNPERLPAELADDMSFCDSMFSRASQPVMWDINGDGIPVIGMAYSAMFANGHVPFDIFAYSDGGYSHIGDIYFFGEPSFHRDSSGRLLALTGHMFDEPEVTFFTVTAYGIYREAMNPQPWQRLSPDFDSLIWDFDNYLIPGLPFAELTPVPRMGALEEEIRASREPVARARFDASFAVLQEQRQQAEAEWQGLPEWRRMFIERLRGTEQELQYWDDGWFSSFGVYNDENFALLVTHHGLGVSVSAYIHGVGMFDDSIGAGLGHSGSGSVWVLPGRSAVYSIASSAGREVNETFHALEGNAFAHRFSAWGEDMGGWDFEDWYAYYSGVASHEEFLRRRSYLEAENSVTPNNFRTPAEAIAALEDSAREFRGEPGNIPPTGLPAPQAAPASGFVIPGSNTRYLTEADVRHLSSEQLRLARNEIYARHGRRFRDAGLQAHFNAQTWYTGRYDPDAFDNMWPSIRNSFEFNNLHTIIAEENRR